MKIEYLSNVEIDKFPLDANNQWNKNFNNRMKFYMDNDATTLDENFVVVYYMSHPLILNRSFDVKEIGYRHEEGVSFFDFPLSRDKEAEIKNNTKPTLTPDQMIIEYYYSFDGIDSEELRKEITYIPRKAFENVIRKHSDIDIQHATIGETNDMLLDGKKVSGGESSLSNNGIYDFFNIIVDYKKWKHLFDKYVAGEENHIKSDRKVSGVMDEIEGITKESFTKEYLEELKVLFDDLENRI